MPTLDFLDIGDVLDYEFLSGVLQTINHTDDTCTVRVGGEVYPAIIFYHCQPDGYFGPPVLRSNGAVQYGAWAFLSSEVWEWGIFEWIMLPRPWVLPPTSDPVVVMKKKDGSVVKVIGFADGFCRACLELNFYIVPPIQE